MIDRNILPSDGGELRMRAENSMQGNAAVSSAEAGALSADEMKHMLHELAVHQVQLEMQNEELRMVQEELEAARLRYSDLYDMAPVGYCTLDRRGCFQQVNMTLANMLGVSRDLLLNRPLAACISPDDQDVWYRLGQKLFPRTSVAQPPMPANDSGRHVCELRMVSNSGEEFWARLEATTSTSIGGEGMLLVVVSDISDRKIAEAEKDAALVALQHSEARYVAIIEDQTELLCRYLPDGRISFVNDAYVRYFGKEREWILNRNFIPNIPKEDIVDIQDHLVRICPSNPLTEFEHRVIMPDGSIRWQYWSHRGIYSPEAELLEFQAVGRDITERKRTEEALQESETKYRSLVETAQELVWICDKNNCFTYLNPAWEKSHGFRLDDMIGRHFRDCMEPARADHDMAEFTRLLSQGMVKEFETVHIARNGTSHTLLLNAVPILNAAGEICGTQGTAIDITERKLLEVERAKSEYQQNQNQKLESLGVLAGGIAHDFNNLMAGIYGYIDLSIDASTSDVITDYLTRAISTIDRAQSLTRQLLTFSKGGDPIRRVTALIPFVQDTVQFALSGSNVSCRFDIPDDLWPCNVDTQQISQVIDNIVINAVQAMPGGGTVEISAGNISPVDERPASLTLGPYVKLSIRDTGCGIAKELLPRIFDPFFTTKAMGHGLGLPTSYSIIKRHDGTIEVDSIPGRGTAFHIYLPASAEVPAVEICTAAVMQTGNGTVLIMDDEQIVRDVLKGILEGLGFAVICTVEGREAVEMYRFETESGRRISALIFDLTVPGGMGGRGAVAEIRKMNADIPVFVVSGYSDDPVMKNPGAFGFTASMKKPFRHAVLAEMLYTHIPLLHR